MNVPKELEEFRQDAVQNASMLNRYITDTSNCLVYRKAFDSDSSSMLTKIPPKTLKLLKQSGDPKSAFDLTLHPAFSGAGRFWWTDRASSIKASNLYQAIASDSSGYVKFLLTTFPDVSAYIRRFHRM